MGKLIGLDYGTKRCGLAVSDDLQIIASALDAVDTQNLMYFLTDYIAKHTVDALIIGEPLKLGGALSEVEQNIQQFIRVFLKKNPLIPIYRQDERFTSKIASKEMVRAGVKKSQRTVKGNIDKVSAVLILQAYMESKR